MAGQNFGGSDQTIGGTQTAINITAPTLINPRRCVLWTVHIIAPGTAGLLTINDAASLDAADDSNVLFSVEFGALTAGQVIPLRWPVTSGIVVSAVPTGASVNIAFSYS
jgi:hypothetical protein